MFGEKSKKIEELSLEIAKIQAENEQRRQILDEVRAALKVPEGGDLTHYCWGLQMTLETNANLLEGAANVIKAADEWFASQKKPRKKATKKNA